MRHLNKLSTKAGLLLLASFIFVACQKQIDKTFTAQEEFANSAKLTHGHLQQTKTFSSDALLRWMDFQLIKYRENFALVQGTAGVRFIAYTGIAAYESVVPGMPAYQSLSTQLTDMPAMPSTAPGLAYYWPECLNAALGYVTKHLLPPALKSPEQLASIDNFESGLFDEFAQQGATIEVLNRSAAFGREVAQRIVEWSKHDQDQLPTTPFFVSNIFDPQTGKWVRTGTLESVSGPYWGYARKMATNSLVGIKRVNPYIYSTMAGSDFRNMAESIYNNTHNPDGFSLAERQLVNTYFRDRPGYGSGHYMSILKLVLAKANVTLDRSALIFAQSGISTMDAGIGCWQVKYDLQNNYVVRPVSYIRTVLLGDQTWNTFMPTPNHPEYPSGHSSLAGAMAEILTEHFGNSFSFVDNTYDGFGVPEYPNGMGSRQYTSFDHMAREIGDSRVYGQIHFPRSCEDGKTLGKTVARNVLNQVKFLKP